MRSFMSASLLIALALLLAVPGRAFAAQDEHAVFDDTYPDTICGIDVTAHAVGVFNGFVHVDGNGVGLLKSTGQQTITYTAANGKQVIFFGAGTSHVLSATINGDGTITYNNAISGVANEYRLPDGTVLAKSVGRIVFALLFSDNGTPSDYSDDFPISMSVVSIAGPHPFATGELNRCDLIAAALS